MRLCGSVLLIFCIIGCEPSVPQAAPAAPAVAQASDSRTTARDLTGTVVDVADGDTLNIRAAGAEHKIRLHGIDCPESGQPFGDKAKQFTRQAASGRHVRIKVVDRDRYGRFVGIVTLPDGSILNEQLVAAGLAWQYVKYAPDDKHLAKLQVEAKAAGRGLWAAGAIPPWEWRDRQKQPAPASVELVPNGVQIVSALPNPAGVDEGNEKIRIGNATGQPVPLDGWRLRDEAGHEFALHGTVPARGELEIVLAPPTMPMNNDGDDLVLLDAGLVARSRFAYQKRDVRSGRWIEKGRQ